MIISRDQYSETSLADGRFLVVGGQSTTIPVWPNPREVYASVEIYDPGTFTSFLAASLSRPRVAHSALLLQDGRVLVMGGGAVVEGEGVFPVPDLQVEIYDPAYIPGSAEIGSWFIAADRLGNWTYFTLTLLDDGRVLRAGGVNSSYGTPTSDLYNPATNTWIQSGDLITGRYGHTEVKLADGRVVISGGHDGYQVNGQEHLGSEIYDPSTGAWSTYDITEVETTPAGPHAIGSRLGDNPFGALTVADDAVEQPATQLELPADLDVLVLLADEDVLHEDPTTDILKG